MRFDETNLVSIVKREEVKDDDEILRQVYQALKEKGYNPETQISGYLLSGDPTYITNYKRARSLICNIDRDALLYKMVARYLESL